MAPAPAVGVQLLLAAFVACCTGAGSVSGHFFLLSYCSVTDEDLGKTQIDLLGFHGCLWTVIIQAGKIN